MGANMNWLLNLPPFEGNLVAIPAIVGAIVLLFEPRHDDDSDVRHG